ncbi:hypothetical protein A1D22_10905 [Pasteurellaceae bacterium LFhippo2]|nr:hypothetical protein [Pasteurellaceae bacterium LFhippo2]
MNNSEIKYDDVLKKMSNCFEKKNSKSKIEIEEIIRDILSSKNIEEMLEYLPVLEANLGVWPDLDEKIRFCISKLKGYNPGGYGR